MRRAGKERGQATVELALCLPVVLFVLGALAEIGLIASDQVRLWHAARESARIAVVEPDPTAARRAAEGAGFGSLRLVIRPEPPLRRAGDPLTVSVEYDRRAVIPVIGALFERVDLEARATMRIEQP
jgi:hypothetical protein